MTTMVAYCESFAAAVGAPFLRADFFVGSPKFGVRLNEVAYGCGCDYRNRTSGELGKMFDDAPAMARILQDGMSVCQARLPPRSFLSKLGVRGDSYAQMEVLPRERPAMPLTLPPTFEDFEEEDSIIPEEQCNTPVRAARILPVASSTPSAPPQMAPSPLPEPLVFEPRSRASEPRRDLHHAAKPSSPRCDSIAPRVAGAGSPRCDSRRSVAGSPRSSLSVGLPHNRSGALTPVLPNAKLVERSAASLQAPKLCRTPQRSPQRSSILAATPIRATSISKARDLSKVEAQACRVVRNAARLGGC